MYMTHTSTLTFKDNRLRTSYSHALLLLTALLINFVPDLGRARTMPKRNRWIRHSSRKVQVGEPHLFRRLTFSLVKVYLGPCYLFAFTTASMSRSRDTKIVISSAYAESFVLRQPSKGTLHRARRAPSSLSLQSKSSKARKKRKATGGNPAGTTARSRKTLFTYTTA